VVLHLAALIAIPFSYHSPDAYVETNIRGTLNLLQAARAHQISKFVHTSTSEVYGSAQYVPIDEKHRLQGQSPYAASKIGADQLAMSFHDSFDLPVSIIRPFNTYGPRQSARAIIPTVIAQIANGYKEIKLGALTPTRDFNYVLDTVRGFTAVAESDRTVGEVVNVGSGYEISIGKVVKRISELMNVKVKIVSDDNRIRPAKSEVERLCCNPALAKKIAGWKPEVSGKEGLDRGLIKTIDWFIKPENLKLYKANIYNV
jgi:NAD dependent epimerase/dehydratase